MIIPEPGTPQSQREQTLRLHIGTAQGPQPGAEDRVQRRCVKTGQRASDRRLRGDSALRCTQGSKEILIGVSSPLADRGERLGAGRDRGDRDSQDPWQGVPNPARAPRIGDRGQQIQQRRGRRDTKKLTGHRGRTRRWHRRVWSLTGCGVDTYIQVPWTTPTTPATPRQAPTNAQVTGLIRRLCRGPGYGYRPKLRNVGIRGRLAQPPLKKQVSPIARKHPPPARHLVPTAHQASPVACCYPSLSPMKSTKRTQEASTGADGYAEQSNPITAPDQQEHRSSDDRSANQPLGMRARPVTIPGWGRHAGRSLGGVQPLRRARQVRCSGRHLQFFFADGALPVRCLARPPLATLSSFGLSVVEAVACVARVRLMSPRGAAGRSEALRDSFEEHGKGVSVPVLQHRGACGVFGFPAQAGNGRDFVNDVGMVDPADRDDAFDAPGVLFVDPDGDLVEPGVGESTKFSRACGWIPGTRKRGQCAEFAH